MKTKKISVPVEICETGSSILSFVLVASLSDNGDLMDLELEEIIGDCTKENFDITLTLFSEDHESDLVLRLKISFSNGGEDIDVWSEQVIIPPITQLAV